MQRASVVLTSLILFTACHTSHQGSASGVPPEVPDGGLLDDGGGVDAGVRGVDAGPPGEDAGPRDGAPMCVSPELISFSPGQEPMVFGRAGETLFLAHRHMNPTPCDGPCAAILDVHAEGPAELSPVYWSRSFGALQVATGPGRFVAFATDPFSEDVPMLHWQRLPRVEERWRRDGEMPLPEGMSLVGAALGDGDTVHLALRRGSDDPELSLLQVVGEGASVTERRLNFANGERSAPRLLTRPARLDSPWLVSVQDWDFPPTVQLETVASDGAGSFHGSSCGVDDYDLVDLGDDLVAVAQRCGSVLELQARVAIESPPIVVSESVAAVAPSITALGPNAVGIAYVDVEGAVAIYEAWVLSGDTWQREQRVVLPSDANVALPLLEVDVAAWSPTTVAVAWRGPTAGEFSEVPEGRVARLGPCL